MHAPGAQPGRFVLVSFLRYSLRMIPFTELPAGYEQALYYSLTSKRLLVALNLAALLPMAAASAVMLVFQQLYNALDAPLSLVFLKDVRLLAPAWDIVVLVGLLVLVFPLHELCHGIAFKLIGVARIRYGIKPKRLVLYAEPDGPAYLRRDDFIFCALAPLIFISAGCMVLTLFLPVRLWDILLLVLVLNAGGAIGDIWTVIVLLREGFSSGVLVRDIGDGFVVYVPITR